MGAPGPGAVALVTGGTGGFGRALAVRLRARGVTGLTIKKRGIRTDEDSLRRQLGVGRKAGDGAQLVLVLTRVGGSPAALVVEAD